MRTEAAQQCLLVADVGQRDARCPVPITLRYLLTEQSGNTFRVGISLDFASSSTRTPHGAYVQMSGRNRIDPHWGEAERLAMCTVSVHSSMCKAYKTERNEPKRNETKRNETKRNGTERNGTERPSNHASVAVNSILPVCLHVTCDAHTPWDVRCTRMPRSARVVYYRPAKEIKGMPRTQGFVLFCVAPPLY